MILTSCTSDSLAVVGDLFAPVVVVSFVLLTAIVISRRKLMGFLSGYFTPKRKVLIAQGLNYLARFFAVMVIVAIALHLFTPFFVPPEINDCLQPF